MGKFMEKRVEGGYPRLEESGSGGGGQRERKGRKVWMRSRRDSTQGDHRNHLPKSPQPPLDLEAPGPQFCQGRAMAPKPASEHLGPQQILPRSVLKLETLSQCQNPPLTKFTSPMRLKCDITRHFLNLQMGYSKLTLISSTMEQVLTGILHYYLNQRDMCSSQLIPAFIAKVREFSRICMPHSDTFIPQNRCSHLHAHHEMAKSLLKFFKIRTRTE